MMLTLAQAGDGTFWFPAQAAENAAKVDDLFYFVLYVSVFFFLLIMTILSVFVIRYRRREGVEPEQSPSHNTVLEIVWSVIPTALVVYMFYAGFTGYLEKRTPPTDAYEIGVTAQKWSWNFTYPNGHTTNVLHLPVGVETQMLMSSEDVIHSFFVPAFREKMDVVPGRYTKAWFTPTIVGTYDLFCAEYCGTQHSEMITKVVVHPQDGPDSFENWLREDSDFLSKLSPSEGGKKVYQLRGCGQCHSLDGTSGNGPTFKDVWGTERVMADGSKVLFDENYVRESILMPKAKVLAGYEPVMPTFQGRIKDAEITALIAFLKSLEQ